MHVYLFIYHIIMYISEVIVQKHQRRGPKQTGKFSTVLQMFPPTVSTQVTNAGWQTVPDTRAGDGK